MKITLKEWKIGQDSDGHKAIGGILAVNQGQTEIAKQNFNLGYGCTKISLPAGLMAKAEDLEDQIREALIKFFEVKNGS